MNICSALMIGDKEIGQTLTQANTQAKNECKPLNLNERKHPTTY